MLEQRLIPLDEVYKHSKDTLLVLGGCHTLAMADGNLVGDPIEKQAFEGVNFEHDGRRTSGPKIGSSPKIAQLKRFLFESSLKRQSAIVNIQDGTTRGGYNRVLCKGAPEVVEKFLKNVPAGYRENYIEYVKNGARVLVLAFKDLKVQADQASKITREEAESDLIFCGFIISECPLKERHRRIGAVRPRGQNDYRRQLAYGCLRCASAQLCASVSRKVLVRISRHSRHRCYQMERPR